MGGEHDHRQVRGQLLELLQRLQPVHDRHVQVEQRHVRQRRRRRGEGLLSVLGQRDIEALGLEHRRQQASVGEGVVGDQHPVGLGHGGLAPPSRYLRTRSGSARVSIGFVT